MDNARQAARDALTGKRSYVTDDGVKLRTGDEAFNYYDMRPGRIGSADATQEGWFRFCHTDGKTGATTLLNGQRICSMEHALKMGWSKRRWDGCPIGTE